MSWWVHLEDAHGRPVPVDRHAEGGTYAIGGVATAELNVTYNYGARFREVAPEFAEGTNVLGRMLDGRRAGDTEPLLARMVEALGTEPDEDYWNATPGNAGRALALLLVWAREHPDATWSVS